MPVFGQAAEIFPPPGRPGKPPGSGLFYDRPSSERTALTLSLSMMLTGKLPLASPARAGAAHWQVPASELELAASLSLPVSKRDSDAEHDTSTSLR